MSQPAAPAAAVDPVTVDELNRRAIYFRYRPAREGGDQSYPCIELDGVRVEVFAAPTEQLRILIHPDQPDKSGARVLPPPIAVSLGYNPPVWELHPIGEQAYPALQDRARELVAAADAVTQHDWPAMPPEVGRALGRLLEHVADLADAVGVSQQ